MNLVERAKQMELSLAKWTVHPWANRAVVLDECDSTQDSAFRLCEGKPGLVVGAINQTSGRGRLGRAWVQRPGLGLALTFVLDAKEHDTITLPIRAGCAVCQACYPPFAVPERGVPPIFVIKWPNDVLVSLARGATRKVAGVLVEQRDGLLLLGIGINVLQKKSDWPPELRDRACSLAWIDKVWRAGVSLEGVAEVLIAGLNRWLFETANEVLNEFQWLDCLTKTSEPHTLQHNGRKYTGKIEEIHPWEKITLRTSDGTLHTLPALASSLVKD